METIETYRTADGKTFTDLHEARKHEDALQRIKIFEVYAKPDLTEGRHGPTLQGYLLLNVEINHEMIADWYCGQKYGNKIAIVAANDIISSNFILSWYAKESTKNIQEIKNDQVIDKIEDKYIDNKIWN